jgi:hypothetical protein
MSILTKIASWFVSRSAKIATAISIGIEWLNKAKVELNSPIVDAVIAATPTQLDNAGILFVRAGLSSFIDVLGWTEKTFADLAKDDDAKSGALTILAAKAAVLTADYKKVKLSIQEAIASVPVAYNPNLVDNKD